jgi:hypothetical protein
VVSAQNVELVRSLQPSGSGPLRLTYHGVAGLIDGWREWLGAWDSYLIEAGLTASRRPRLN